MGINAKNSTAFLIPPPNPWIKNAEIEQKNIYKDAIEEISTWIFSAFQKNYLIENEKCYPNPLYAIKKGVEILHSFLHRDLRRRQFSSEEEEIYRNYRSMVNNLPNPKKIES